MRFLDREGFARLLDVLVGQGYALVGPTVRDGAIVLEEIDSVHDLPRGVREVQGPGTYRLERTDDDRLFSWAHGPDSAKRFLFPARETIATGTRAEGGRISLEAASLPDIRYAFVGLRACDLAAIEIQDRVFLLADPAYRTRRESAVFIGVNCGSPGETCFCTSMGTGPRCTSGFDVALTEIGAGFTAESATARGASLLDDVRAVQATEEQIASSVAATASTLVGTRLPRAA